MVSEVPSAEKVAPVRHQCGDCGRYVSEASVVAFTDFESGITDATGTCGQCGRVDVLRVLTPGVGDDT